MPKISFEPTEKNGSIIPMRIAYISYEHPSSIGTGGIGTYVSQISKVMAARNHSVEVFCGTLNAVSSYLELDGYRLNLIPCQDKTAFKNAVVTTFKARHSTCRFDIIESPEFSADALEIKKSFSQIPLIVKLHTPSFLINKLNAYNNGLIHKIRFIAGGLIRLKKNKFYWKYDKYKDPEYQLFNLADSVISPSASLAKIVNATWSPLVDIQIVPNPFMGYQQQSKPVSTDSHLKIVVTFIGKLEKRKGILDLMAAIPLILRQLPQVEFRFVGSPSESPDRKLNMEDYLKKKLKKHISSLKFLGFQPPSEIVRIMEDSHICIFPSLWENFPYVCLEAMAAGRGIIGTDNGGMANIITNNVNGLLIPPGSPKAIYKAVRSLVLHPDQIFILGEAAKADIADKFNENLVGKLTEDIYLKTIARK